MRGIYTLSLAALVAVMAAVPPASAQFSGWGRPSGGNINATQSNLQARINAGIASRRLSRSEANRLNSKLSQISQIEANMRTSGRRLSFKERSDLNLRLSRLNREITRELNDFEHRRVGYWGDRYWR